MKDMSGGLGRTNASPAAEPHADVDDPAVDVHFCCICGALLWAIQRTRSTAKVRAAISAATATAPRTSKPWWGTNERDRVTGCGGDHCRALGRAFGRAAPAARARSAGNRGTRCRRRIAVRSGRAAELVQLQQLRYLRAVPAPVRLPVSVPAAGGAGRPAADFGTAAHGAFEAFTRERRERLARGEQPPTRADLDLYFEAAWAKTSLSAEADAETWHRHAEPMLDRFWAAEMAAEPETVGEEVRFRLELPLDPDASAVVTGYIDRIDRLPSGAVELIDYKSGPATSPEQAERSLQLSIYALACRDALDLGRPERVTLYCVEQSRRFSAERTDAALDALRDDLAARARAIRGSDFAPTPSPRSCGWCDFTGLCPASER